LLVTFEEVVSAVVLLGQVESEGSVMDVDLKCPYVGTRTAVSVSEVVFVGVVVVVAKVTSFS
jgi:hypothetical protein